MNKGKKPILPPTIGTTAGGKKSDLNPKRIQDLSKRLNDNGIKNKLKKTAR